MPERKEGYQPDDDADEKVESSGTAARGQAAEFIDTPGNEPGQQEKPPDTSGLGHRQVDRSTS
jgi:hypothetical protein